MIGLLLGKARLWLIGLAAAIAALFAAYTRGSKDARDKGALAAAERKARAMTIRKEIDHEIDQDTSLADRAAHVGVVRPGGK